MPQTHTPVSTRLLFWQPDVPHWRLCKHYYVIRIANNRCTQPLVFGNGAGTGLEVDYLEPSTAKHPTS